MASGGYRRPSGPQPPAGPGKFSTRTDAMKPPPVAPLNGSDLQYGDVGKLHAAQAAVPIPRANGATAARGPAMGSAPPPDFLFGGDSTRPNSPGSSGLPMGPGPGPEALPPMEKPDDRELILEYIARNFNNEEAAQMLQNIREERAQMQAPGMGGPVPTPQDQAPSDFALPPQAPQPPMAGDLSMPEPPAPGALPPPEAGPPTGEPAAPPGPTAPPAAPPTEPAPAPAGPPPPQ